MNLSKSLSAALLFLAVAHGGDDTLHPAVGECDSVRVSNSWGGGYSIDFRIPVKRLTHQWIIEIKFSSPVSSLKAWDAKSSTGDQLIFQLSSYPYNQRLLAGSVLSSVGVNVFYPPADGPPAVDSITFNGEQICDGKIIVSSDGTTRKRRPTTTATPALSSTTRTSIAPSTTVADSALTTEPAAWTTSSAQRTNATPQPTASTQSSTAELMLATEASDAKRKMKAKSTTAKRTIRATTTKRPATSRSTTSKRTTTPKPAATARPTRRIFFPWRFSLFHFYTTKSR